MGRFSGNNPSEIATQVERSLDCEQSPTQTSFNNALGIASNQGPGMNGYTMMTFKITLNTLISDTYGSYQYEYDGSGTPHGITINSGVGLINYWTRLNLKLGNGLHKRLKLTSKQYWKVTICDYSCQCR